jgi:hypothetical protein
MDFEEQQSFTQDKFTALDVVFKGSVRFGLLTLKWKDRNRNRSRTIGNVGGTEPDLLGPVYIGPVVVF